MAADNRLVIEKDVYLWAIRESQIDYDVVIDRFKHLDAWISQSQYPTFRDGQKLAQYLRVPFGFLFLDEAPEDSALSPEFRTIKNILPKMSKNLQDTLYLMKQKQEWLSDYRKENDRQTIIPKDLVVEDKEQIPLAKKLIGLDEYWYKMCGDLDTAFKTLRQAMEDIGIVVMQNSVVGTNNRRPLDIHEFRGFLIYDDLAPLIFINSRDSKAGKIFTLVHEYIHLLSQSEEDDLLADPADSERAINQLTSEFLMPARHVLKSWDQKEASIEQINKISKTFCVSPIAMAIRLNRLGKIDQEMVDDIKWQTKENLKQRRAAGGGDYYQMQKSRLSSRFTESVIEGREAGGITYTQAFDLLDGSMRLYDRFKGSYMREMNIVP